MRYDITTDGQTYTRTREDNDSRLRIFNIGDYPVEVAINGGSYSEPFYRNQSFDISITKTPVTIRSIGGNSEVRTYRVYCSNVDECDIEGYFEPLTVESYESLIAKNAVLKSDIAQNLTNPTEVDVPSTKAVVATLTEFMSNFGSPLRYKGSVKTYNDLPTSDRVVGDMYNVEEPSDDYVAGTNFAWTGEVWDALGGTLSVLPSAITKFNETVTKAVQDFESLAVLRKTELTEIYERAVLAISGEGGLVEDAKETLQSYVDKGYEYEVNTQSNLEQVKTLASEVEDDKRQVVALEQSVRANTTEVRKLKEDLGDISSAVKTATTAESNVRALESSAWLAANRAEEISDPEGRISSLQQTKVNEGELVFKGGTLKALRPVYIDGAFTCVWTAARGTDVYGGITTNERRDWVYTVPDQGSEYKGFLVKSDDKFLGFYFRWKKSDSSLGRLSITLNASKYFDGKPHTYAYIFDGISSVRLLIDNVEFFKGVVDDFVPFTTTLPLTIASPDQTCSRIKYFDFDMSSSTAPYTLEDYIAGREESPLLNQPNPTQDWHSMPTSFSRDASTGKITMTNTSTVMSYPFAIGTLKQGVSYKIKVNGSILNPSRVDGIRLYLPTDSYTLNRTNITTGETETKEYNQSVVFLFKTDGNEWNVEVTFVCNANSTNDNAHLKADAVDTSRENYFYFSAETVGTRLSLNNYVINGKVLDNSTKENHAIVSGFVESTINTKIKAFNKESQYALCQTKSNRGEFWFNGGTSNLSVSKLTYNQGDSFSFAVQIKAKSADITSKTRIFQFNTFNLYFNPRLRFYEQSVFNKDEIITTVEQNNKILDGNWHSIICTYDGITCKLFDEDGLLISASGTMPNIANTYFLIGNNGFVGQMSRIKYFNFDMSIGDAPYTIADYISGKDESPLLKLGVQSYNASDMVFSSVSQTSYPCEVVSDSTDGTITVTTTGEISAEYVWIDGRANAIAIPQGANVEVSVGNLDVATSVQGYFYSGATRVQTLTGVSNDNPTISFVAPANLTRLSLIVHTGVKPIPTGTTMVITGLKIKVNGALLSLDDYTFNGKVFDASGNNNTATITGAVYGSRDNAVEQMYQAFASRIQNVTTE